MAPRPEIPGYYFDTTRNKYFKIQPNHVAPPGTAHSRAAVLAEIERDRLERATLHRRERERSSFIRRLNPGCYDNLSLTLRYGASPRQNVHSMTRLYASNLHDRQIDFQSRPLSLTVSAEGTLYLTATASFGVNIREVGSGDRTQNNATILPVPDRTGTVIRDGTYLTFSRSNLEYAHFGSHAAMQLGLDTTIWDAALPGYGSCVLATEDGLAYSPDLAAAPLQPLVRKEQMTLSMKDTNVVMSGERRGIVNFTDLRSRGTVPRLKHTSAITGIAVTRRPEQVIVSGLSSVALYDLRYLKEPAQPKTTTYPKEKRKRGLPTLVQETRPLVPFCFPPERQAESYGSLTSLTYIHSHNIAAVASRLSNTPFKNDIITLFDVSKGSILPSPLTSCADLGHVVGVVAGHFGDGLESLVTATWSGQIREWAVDSEETEE
ncbi:hypothetical protein LTR05_002589 [Lithohypha guttulata]|uniref:Uncharacterized protein n=1 Tax=Lithohypha guttulata TaxID=1690604 RepID=A0AAN7T2P2_9EURO|nr:hypothetical protein LTR05_002589 [Lithohypha guttulata]